jgi:hypothetical protein
MARLRRSENERLQLALTARRMVEQELTATPAPSLKEAHARVAIRLGVTTRTLRTRLSQAPATPTHEDAFAALVVYRDRPSPTFEELVTAHQGDAAAAVKHFEEGYRRDIENLFDVLRRRFQRTHLSSIDAVLSASN